MVMRSFKLSGVVAAGLLSACAVSASASTVILSGGESGDGLNLANALVATTAVGGAGATVQGVNFATPTPTYSDPPTDSNLIGGTTAADGVTVNISAPFRYSASGVTYSPDNTVNQPDDNDLKTALKVISGNYGPPIVVSVSGLADNAQYAVDVLQSSSGYNGRTQTVSFSDPTVLAEVVNLDSTDVYNTHDVLTSDGSGDLSVTISDNAMGNSSVLNGFVISTAVPEPASLGLMSIATLGLMGRRRRKYL
jgi:hypothetical protein